MELESVVFKRILKSRTGRVVRCGVQSERSEDSRPPTRQGGGGKGFFAEAPVLGEFYALKKAIIMHALRIALILKPVWHHQPAHKILRS